MQYYYTEVKYNTSHSSSTHDIRHDQRQLVHGTPVQLLRAQTSEAVAYMPTLAQPSARNSRYGIRGGGCGGCVSHRQELATSTS